MGDLKPCPFCGSNNIWMHYRGTTHGRIAFIKCSLCGATSKAFSYYGSEEDVNENDEGMQRAIEAWNRRTK